MSKQAYLKSRSCPGSETYQANIRLKPQSLEDLLYCRAEIERKASATASNSLIMKRAIRVYRQHLEQLSRTGLEWSSELKLIEEAR